IRDFHVTGVQTCALPILTGGVGSSDCIRSASMGKIRLYIDHGFAPGQPVPLDAAQAHYLGGVMRQPVGAEIAVFNGRDGEWAAQIGRASGREARKSWDAA